MAGVDCVQCQGCCVGAGMRRGKKIGRRLVCDELAGAKECDGGESARGVWCCEWTVGGEGVV